MDGRTNHGLLQQCTVSDKSLIHQMKDKLKGAGVAC